MPQDKDLEFQKETLINRLAELMEAEEKLPPMAARIYATLIFTSEEGLTFDQLVQSVQGSKSTVCTHIQSLQEKDLLSDYSKPGERKRYFVLSPNVLINYIDKLSSRWKRQREFQKDVLEYKNFYNRENPTSPLDLHLHQNHLIFLKEAEDFAERIKQQFQNNNLINAKHS
jgi:DNA-binding transcriptional regulator GbsR (MarR family)